MIRKVMAEAIDVKAGLKLVLDKLESAYIARSKVINLFRLDKVRGCCKIYIKQQDFAFAKWINVVYIPSI